MTDRHVLLAPNSPGSVVKSPEPTLDPGGDLVIGCWVVRLNLEIKLKE